jgi:predicted O-methyltransferase YrrM
MNSTGKIMNSLTNSRVAELLANLHQEAESADRSLKDQITAAVAASGKSLEEFFAEKIAKDKADYKSGLSGGEFKSALSGQAERFLAISPSYGRFLYTCVRASRATRIIEFGTSMGISTIYLAAGLRDNGGGQMIGSEIEPAKVARARANVEAAGLSDLVDIREGDALETLRDVGGEVDVLLLDGAFPLYLPVLKLIEPRLRTGALVLAENALDPDYLDYVRSSADGYLSQSVALDEPRGNEFTVVTG